MPFQDAYERILQSTDLRTQTDVAALLGIKQSSISEAKRRGHIPNPWLDVYKRQAHGSEVLATTNDYEVIRFTTQLLSLIHI